MARFVFISGSELLASSWDQCCALLAGEGHETLALDLRGVPADVCQAAHLLADRIGCHPDTVLVGHSLAGLFLPLIGDLVGARREIFLAALVPSAGHGFVEQIFESREEVFLAEWVACYGRRSPAARQIRLGLLLHDCPPDSARFCREDAAFDVAAIYEDVFPLSVLPARPRSYIVCRKDRTISPHWQRFAACRWLDGVPWELPSGHCPQLAMPHDLVALLLAMVESRRTV